MPELLVVANETVGGRRLLEALRQRAKVHDSLHVRLVVPQNRPRHGSVIYVDAAAAAAQTRLELGLAMLLEEGIDATGEVGDPDPFAATMDAIGDRMPDEIIISTLPATASGWLRRDLVERVAEASGLPVQHVVTDIDAEGLPYDISLVVANQTADSPALLANLKEKAASGGDHVFIIVVPQSSADAPGARESAAHLKGALAALHDAGLLASGLVGDPDPFTATMNALQFFRVNRVIISTLPETRSGWMRADLIERVGRYAACPVEHVVAEPEAETEPETETETTRPIGA
ncbi:MAG: hypothetical protein QOD61_399 [Solirubrobacteraceae bacterium]|nr:hypothetical protein [Solirubrobacteraceae bacterium]